MYEALKKLENKILIISTTSIKRPHIKAFFLALILAPLFLVISCQKPSINFAGSFNNNNSTNIIVIDTVDAELSTIQLDSLNTTASGSLLIGRYQDPFLGLITARTYLQVGPPSVVPAISNQAGFDSVVLILRPNKSFYGDTTQIQRYIVSQLDTVIILPSMQTTFYNNSRFAFDSISPLGYTDAGISPSIPFTSQLAHDSLKIKLSDPLGQQLFNMIVDHSDTLKNVNSFISFFRGLCIYPDPISKGAIYGFTDSILFRVYYHESGITLNYKWVDFPINNRANQFNNITVDRSNTPTQILDSILHANNKSVSGEAISVRTGNASYVQPATGLETKIRFPNLWQIAQLPDYLSVLKAILIIKPVMGTYSPLFPLPPRLTLFQTNENNFLGAPLTGNGNLVVDYNYGTNTEYTYDITRYIVQQINAGAVNNFNDGLILTVPPPGNNTTFNRVVIGDRLNPKSFIQLKLYYASYH